jgi:soluble lytic murein transglycosylase-like protein
MRRTQRLLVRLIERGVLLVSGGLLVGVGLSVSDQLQADKTPLPPSLEVNLELARLGGQVEELQGKLAVTDLKLERLTRVSQYSAAYRVPADQAATIYDAALAEGLHPSLGFQLVKVESGFRPSAQSHKSALGLTQVRLATAREVEPGITQRQLLNPETNLRIGFRVLRRLLRRFDNDLEWALRAYNMGPTGALMSLADTTSNAWGEEYAAKVMRGMKR